MTKFVIEHLEESLSDWSLLEYTHISKITGKGNLIFSKCNYKKLKELGEVREESFAELGSGKICVLDPNSDKLLTPEVAKRFDYLVFGGILGNNPPENRTKPLSEKIKKKLNCETRNLGKVQMSTDTAVYVAKKILDGTPFEKIEFKDEIEIDVQEGEAVILPYRYAVENGKIVLPNNFAGFLRNREEF